MSVTIKTKGQYPVSNWSGGSTTELYLDPPQASYAQRNFGVRVSSATVECERSQFTALPGVERIILPLRGQLHLYYEGHGEKRLQPDMEKSGCSLLSRTALTAAGTPRVSARRPTLTSCCGREERPEWRSFP